MSRYLTVTVLTTNGESSEQKLPLDDDKRTVVDQALDHSQNIMALMEGPRLILSYPPVVYNTSHVVSVEMELHKDLEKEFEKRTMGFHA